MEHISSKISFMAIIIASRGAWGARPPYLGWDRSWDLPNNDEKFFTGEFMMSSQTL